MASGEPIYQITDYDQGQEGGTMSFDAVWNNSPLDSLVSFHAMTDPEGGPVTLPLTTLRQANAVAGTQRKVQSGYRSQIVLVFFPSAPVPANFSVTLRVSFVAVGS